MIQNIEFDKGDIPKDLSGDTDKLLILFESNAGPKKEAVGKLVHFKMLSPEEQIRRLLSMFKIDEAYKIFCHGTCTH